MAATARPGPPDARDARDARDPRDARVPCPLCGGLIHPIAGKCKHCKADLTAYRATRPAANAPLPALNHAAGAPSNGQAVHAPIAHAQPPPAGYDAGHPVLPPRPTARVHTAPPTGAWRSWPIVVIVVAMMAIVAAAVLMMWPRHASDGKRLLQPPPAPERMDTQTPPVAPRVDPSPSTPPRQSQSAPHDPWSPAPADPPANPGTAQADPDDATDVDLDAIDPFDRPSTTGRGRRALALNARGRMARAMTAHLCRKMVQCGSNDLTLQRTCDALAGAPIPPPAACPAAERCFQQIDALNCSAPPDASQLGMLIARMSDCADALQC